MDLEPQNYGPDETENQSGITIHDIFCADTLETDLKQRLIFEIRRNAEKKTQEKFIKNLVLQEFSMKNILTLENSLIVIVIAITFSILIILVSFSRRWKKITDISRLEKILVLFIRSNEIKCFIYVYIYIIGATRRLEFL